MGAAVAYLNYIVSKYLIKNKPDMYTGGQIIRSAIQIGYLLIIFTLGGYTPWDKTWLLIGGCLGITLPMFYFTVKLVKFNDKKKEEDKDGPRV
ncbi:MAG: hypothetical protein IJB24_04845 [Clostridia bacterium]|nr:hypothetical protein [Clostridia bacterium]MBQ4602171.1 hypothetical protein [Clostridia bacterium]